MNVRSIELECIAEEAIKSMERALLQAMNELIRGNTDLDAIDDVSAMRWVPAADPR